MKREQKGAMPIQKITSIGGYVFGLIAIMAAIIIGAALYAVFADENGEPSAAMAGRVSGGGCFLKDEAFTDVNTVGTAETIVSKLEGENKTRATDQIDKVKKIVSEASSYSYTDNSGNPQVGVNPAILVAFWAGEQSFVAENDYKAFGCGDFGGSDRGFDKQIACALPRIRDTILVKGEYTDPTGANRWNRLLYSYVSAARKASYDKFGYVSDATEPRIVILKQIVPSQVECVTSSSGGIASEDKTDSSWITDYTYQKLHGGSLASLYQSKSPSESMPGTMSDNFKLNSDGSVKKRTVTGVILHYTADEVKPEDVTAQSILNTMYNDGNYINMIIDSDGKVYKLLPFDVVMSSGSGDANSFAISIEIIGRGEADLRANKTQFKAVVDTINKLKAIYPTILNARGNRDNLRAEQGIFGHYQTQCKSNEDIRTGNTEYKNRQNYGIDCGKKNDPGKIYMNDIWTAIGAT